MSGLSNSTPVLVEDLGLQYNQTGKISKVKRKHRFGLYKCPYCGSLFRALSSSIKNGNTKSCGYLKLKGHTTHGLSKNKYYHTWVGMIQRCTNQDKDNYKHYEAEELLFVKTGKMLEILLLGVILHTQI